MKQHGEIMVARRRRLTLRWSDGGPGASAFPAEIDYTAARDVEKLDSYSQAIAAAAFRVGRAIVSIQTGSPESSRAGVGLGSGVVVSPSGIIVTSAQVVHDSDALTVRFPDGRKFAATIVGIDAGTDVAVLSVPMQDAACVALDNGAAVGIGDTIIAVGNPMGHHSVISTGVVTALGRSLRSRANWLLDGLIQHTAHPYAGNAGGALLDRKGAFVGLLTESIALGHAEHFAIPVRTATWVVPQLCGRGAVRRGRIGVSGEARRLTTAEKELHVLLQDNGVAVLGVEVGGPAHSGGLQQGDCIVSLNAQPCSSLEELHRFLSEWPLRRALRVTLLRGSDKLDVEILPTDYGI